LSGVAFGEAGSLSKGVFARLRRSSSNFMKMRDLHVVLFLETTGKKSDVIPGNGSE
jgi:hypothetical protein